MRFHSKLQLWTYPKRRVQTFTIKNNSPVEIGDMFPPGILDLGGAVICGHLSSPDGSPNFPFASSSGPHMWLADGDSLVCFIVRMSRLIA